MYVWKERREAEGHVCGNVQRLNGKEREGSDGVRGRGRKEDERERASSSAV